MTPSDVPRIAVGPAPGALGRIVELHADYYHRHWGFGLFFEVKVAVELAAFLEGYEPSRDGFWTVREGDRTQGSLALDGRDAGREGAHLRWFIVAEGFQGRGFGRGLLSRALDFARERAYPRVYLWTFRGLDPAAHLYRDAGFRLVEERPGARWGTPVLEQRYELPLGDTPGPPGQPSR
jgi:GNAT superfamily N-acetyltransferase